MLKSILITALVLFLSASNAPAQSEADAAACAGDIKTQCAGTEPGDGRIRACLKEHLKDLSEPCQARLGKIGASAKACVEDVKRACAGVRPGGGRIGACMKSALANLSDTCKDAVTRVVARRK
jgi:hypothetical protein